MQLGCVFRTRNQNEETPSHSSFYFLKSQSIQVLYHSENHILSSRTQGTHSPTKRDSRGPTDLPIHPWLLSTSLGDPFSCLSYIHPALPGLGHLDRQVTTSLCHTGPRTRLLSRWKLTGSPSSRSRHTISCFYFLSTFLGTCAKTHR